MLNNENKIETYGFDPFFPFPAEVLTSTPVLRVQHNFVADKHDRVEEILILIKYAHKLLEN